MWWLSSIAEKAVLKTPAYSNLIQRISEESGAETRSARGPSLLGTLWRGIVSQVRWSGRVILAKTLMLGRRSPISVAGSEDIVLTYFPLLDVDVAREGVMRTRYLPSYEENLQERGADTYAYVCISVRTGEHSILSAMRLARKFAGDQNVFLIEEFARFGDAVRIAVLHLRYVLRYVTSRNKLRGLFVYPSDRPIDVWDLFEGDVLDSFAGPALVSGLRYMLLFERMTDCLGPGSLITTVCELQPWERALYGAARSRGLLMVGAQHTHVPALQLNYFHDASEVGWSGDSKEAPLPDVIACVGSQTAQTFRDQGWPDERVLVWGAQRFDVLQQIRSERALWNDRDDSFACILSLNRDEAGAMLQMLSEVERLTPTMRILVRSHPALDLQTLLRESGIEMDPAMMEVTEEPLESLVGRCRGMIVMGSSASFHALAAGCPIVIPRFDGIIDVNPLSYISDLPVYVYSTSEMGSELERILAANEQPVSLDECDAFLNSYLYYPSEGRGYAERLHQAVERATVSQG